MRGLEGSMIIETAEVQQFLESKGFARDNSELFTFVGYYEDRGKLLLMDEGLYLQDLNMLIEDAEDSGATRIASALREWRQSK